MRFKHNIILVGCILLFQNFSFAHDPKLSSIKLIATEKVNFLNFSLSQHGIEVAFEKKYPELKIRSLNPTKFKEMIIAYIKETVLISVNNKKIKIGKGVIKLGSHQTDLGFRLEDFPENVKSVNVDAHCFQENNGQSNIFTIIYKEGIKARAKLSASNKFKSNFIFTETEILVKEYQEDSGNGNMYWIISFFLGLIIIVFLGLKFKKK